MQLNHPARIPSLLLLATSALLATACSEPAPPPKAPPPPAQAAAPSPAPAEPAAAPPAAAATSAPAPAPAARPAESKPAKPAARPAKPKVVEVVREKLGAGQCRTCHKLQYDSWVKSGHARKALDCEGCHGNGAEYAKASVMKDLAAAKRAGLIFQTAAFCEKCHPTADDSFLPKAHAHPPNHQIRK